MEFTLSNFIKSGAVRHMCYYADTIESESERWGLVYDYARREFRGATEEQLVELINHCQECYADGMRITQEGGA